MQSKTTIWSRNFLIVFIATGFVNFGQSMVSNLLPSYLNSLGLTATFIGFIISMFSYTALGFRPITGPLIGGWDKKKLYRIVMGAMMLSFVLYGVAGSSIPVVMIARLMHGFGQGCLSALSLAMITEWLPSDKFASGISVFGLSGVVGQAMGPAIGLTIAEHFSYNLSFLVAAGFFVICFGISFFINFGPAPEGKLKFTLKGMICKAALVPAFLLTLTMLVRASTNFLVVFISDERHIEGIKVYFFVNAAANLLFRPMMAKLADKKGLPFAMAPVLMFFALTMVAISFCHNTATLMVVAVLHALGYGSIFGFLQAMCMKAAKPEDRGAASSTAYIGIDLGDLIGPTIWGVVIDLVGYSRMYLFNIIPIALAAVTLYTWAAKHRDILDPAAAN